MDLNTLSPMSCRIAAGAIAEAYPMHTPSCCADVAHRALQRVREYTNKRLGYNHLLSLLHMMDGYRPHYLYRVGEDMSGADRQTIIESLSWSVVRSVFLPDAREALQLVHELAIDATGAMGASVEAEQKRHERIIAPHLG